MQTLIETPAVIAKAVDAAERLLRSAGTPYAIQMPDGVTRGSLPVQRPPEKLKRQRRVASGFWRQHYLPHLENLEPGGLAVIPVPEGFDATHFQAPISAYCSKHFGSRQFMTTVEGQTVQVLRMEVKNG